MLTKPNRETRFIKFPGGEREDGGRAFRITRNQFEPVHPQKQFSRDQRCALVAIDEWMILDDSDTVCGGNGQARRVQPYAARFLARASAESSKPSSRLPAAPPCSANCM